MSAEVTSTWVTVGDRTFWRLELYGPSWAEKLPSLERVAAAPFGGPILILEDQLVRIFSASGQEMSCFRWQNAPIVAYGWSTTEEAIFVCDDGSVMAYDQRGSLQRMFSMGQEAKDLKVVDAKVFRTKAATGVAVLTRSSRFFLVNNVEEPKVRKLPDVELSIDQTVWAIVAGGQDRHAKVAVVSKEMPSAVKLVSLAGISVLQNDQTEARDGQYSKRITRLLPSVSGATLIVMCEDGHIWLADTNGGTGALSSVHLSNGQPDDVAWCAQDAIVAIYPSLCQMQIISLRGGGQEPLFLSDFLCLAQEPDGARVLTAGGQDLVQEVPACVVDAHAIGGVAPSSLLRHASEEFAAGSHRADDYLREITSSGDGERALDRAVSDCVIAAGHVWAPESQKELLRAAQFGKSFQSGTSVVDADSFTQMCLHLRILNSLRSRRIGIPMTINQFNFLTPQVVVDRLLNRRLYPLALKVCQLLKLPLEDGENRVLAHWACYKVSQPVPEGADPEADDLAVARTIGRRLGHHPRLSYADIAAKAADCGRKKLAVRLLEHEPRVGKQVPLLVQLGQESVALSKALASGNRDLAFSVILHLKSQLSPADFHMLIRKYPLGRVLFASYCRQNDPESLEDWHIQEDNYPAMAERAFTQAYETNRYETRMTRLLNAQEYWQKSKQDVYQGLTEDNLKLLRHQSSLEDKLGVSFVGLTAHQTIAKLLTRDQVKMAEKIKSDLKVSDRQFSWLRTRSLVVEGQWTELKKLMRMKRPPLPPAPQVVRLIREAAGDGRAKEFLTEEFVPNANDRSDLLAEFSLPQ